MSAELKKAFDTVCWDVLFAVMKRMGLGDCLVS